jgi:starch synthase
VFTIHNIQYQGIYGKEILGDVFGLGEENMSLIEFGGDLNLMKAGIECANKVTTVSRTYAQEILDPWFSHGLHPILQERSYKLSGILNGIDVDNYNPETDKAIPCNYSASDFSGKAKCKAALQESFGLPVRDDVPVMAIISRLVSHKGFDLVKRIMWEQLSAADMQLIVLGSGDWEYEEYFRALAGAFPDKVGLRLGFLPDVARQIYAGSDLFLMPSKSEPCGLSQRVALRYGTVPVVRETGGLKDTVTDSGDGMGNGFTFKSYDAYDMQDAIWRSLGAYSNREYWEKLVDRAMRCDNSWDKSAKEYIALYKSIE